MAGVVIVQKADRAATSLTPRGFGESMTCLVVHDGRTDNFASMPATVRKRFKGAAGIRSFMGVQATAKIFALVVENYSSKGQWVYTVENTRTRVGFGKSVVKHIPPVSTTRSHLNQLFGGSATPRSQAVQDAPAS